MDKNDILNMIFADDDLGILNEKPRQHAPTEQDRTLESFLEIESFVRENGREPERNPKNMREFKLASRLKSFRENPSIVHSLNVKDDLKLLPIAPIKTTLDDIFGDDTFVSLFSDEDNIFNLKHVTPIAKKEEADFIARRKPCANFEQYEEGFKQVHEELARGERRFIKYGNETLEEGEYYIHNGILFLLETKNITQEEGRENGKRKRKDGRTRCIFENGTESNMLYRTISKNLYANGAMVSRGSARVNQTVDNTFAPKANIPDNEIAETGFIYVLKSLSTDAYIATTKNLYKIGFCTTTVDERIKNADKDPTFLLAPVKIVTVYKCVNVVTQKLEKLLHYFFADACMNLTVIDNGQTYTPREWFALPISAICSAIEIIASDLTNGTERIKNYRYDKDSESLVENEGK